MSTGLVSSVDAGHHIGFLVLRYALLEEIRLALHRDHLLLFETEHAKMLKPPPSPPSIIIQVSSLRIAV